MKVTIRPMTIEDYDAVYGVWTETEGLGLSEADTRENVARYLERNPGMSFVAREGERVVGAILCGHDGRLGFIHHLAMAASHRRTGIGHDLAEHCRAALEAAGIRKCYLFVFATNHDGIAFWKTGGWKLRDEVFAMSRTMY